MATDRILLRELKSLQEELATSERNRQAPSASEAAAVVGSAPAAAPVPLEETAEERELRGDLRELVSEIREFVESAEKNIAAHPTKSVLAAMLLGILIGRALGGR